jgi:tetratricopeptide (TPR) repeat protein
MAEEDIFREIANLDSIYEEEKYYHFNIDGILVNIGTKKKSIPLLSMAKKRLSKKLQDSKHDVLMYNLGNAYHSIAGIEINEPLADSIQNKELRIAREKFNSISIGFLNAQANTNHANILERLGRNYEAISLYDKALMTNRNFGMALANKARAILYYYELT